MPPIKDLMTVDLDAVAGSFDANDVAALRLTRLFVARWRPAGARW